ncbi:hypothetical protein AB1I63_05975 [Streptococcus pneumoniae]
MKFEEAKKLFYELHDGWVLYDVENNPNALVQTENTQYWQRVLLPALIKQNAEIEHAHGKYRTLYRAFFNDIEDFTAKVEENRENKLITTKSKHEQNTTLYHKITDKLEMRVSEINQAQALFLDHANKVLEAFKGVLQENCVPEVKINRLADIPMSEKFPISLAGIELDIRKVYTPFTTPYSERDIRFYKRWIKNEYLPDSSNTWYWELFYKEWGKSGELGIDAIGIHKALKHKYNYNSDKVAEHIAKAFEDFWERYELEQIEKRKDELLLQELKQTKTEKERKSIFGKWLGGNK